MVFNADEVLQMAERIEENGVIFYTRAAVHWPAFQDTFSRLANQEKEHRARFAKMRAELSAAEREATTYDPDQENSLYLQAMADREVFQLAQRPPADWEGLNTLADLVNFALGIEKDSIVFYVGLKALVPKEIGADRIDLIIKEEFKHIAVLRKLLLKS